MDEDTQGRDRQREATLGTGGSVRHLAGATRKKSIGPPVFGGAKYLAGALFLQRKNREYCIAGDREACGSHLGFVSDLLIGSSQVQIETANEGRGTEDSTGRRCPTSIVSTR
jgi:hypothetical protein